VARRYASSRRARTRRSGHPRARRLRRRQPIRVLFQQDVEAAARRLDVLLEKDTNGEPRKDVPRRGYYLNIVV
jgi:hypothetical protein